MVLTERKTPILHISMAASLGFFDVEKMAFRTDKLKELGMDESERVYGALAVGYPDTADGLPEREPLKRIGNKVTVIDNNQH